MPNPKTDTGGFSTTNTDRERDLAAKGGPATGTGIADDKHGIASPASDLQTQIVIKSKKNKKTTGRKNAH